MKRKAVIVLCGLIGLAAYPAVLVYGWARRTAREAYYGL